MAQITKAEQLSKWLQGESIHADIPGMENGRCTPDFSCCHPELLAPKEVREAFIENIIAEAPTVEIMKRRLGFMQMFVQRMLKLEDPNATFGAELLAAVNSDGKVLYSKPEEEQ